MGYLYETLKRQKAAEILPVPVLVESGETKSRLNSAISCPGDEARESTFSLPDESLKGGKQTRGGQTPQQRWREKRGKAYFAKKQRERRAKK